MTDAVIIDAVRTPIGKGKPNGTLAAVHPVDVHAHAIRSLLERTGIDPAAAAVAAGKFARQVVPLKAPGPDGALRDLTTDETVRPGTTTEILAGLRSAFRADVWEQRFPELGWHVTAGNSSPINDRAAAVLITSSETAAKLGLRPRARIHSFAVGGDGPQYMLPAIVPATPT